MLANTGFVTESACLLRVVSDFTSEIVAVAEGAFLEEPTSVQQKFVRQFFEPPASLNYS